MAAADVVVDNAAGSRAKEALLVERVARGRALFTMDPADTIAKLCLGKSGDRAARAGADRDGSGG